MSNDLPIVKPALLPRERIIARGHVLLTVCGIGALAAAVPGPTTAFAMMSGPAAASSSEPFGPAGDALLIAAALLVWGLLVWITLLACSAALTRVPGIAGRMGSTVLGKIAPAAARNLLIAAVGAALITQVAGCAEGGPSAGPAVAVAALTTPGSGSAASTDPASTDPASTAPASTAPPSSPTGTAARGVPSPSGGLTPTAPMPMLDWPTGGDPSPTTSADVPSANDRTDGGPDGARNTGLTHTDSPGTVTPSTAPTNPVPTNPVPTNPVPTNPAPTNPVSPGAIAAGTTTAGTPEDPATGARAVPTAESPAQHPAQQPTSPSTPTSGPALPAPPVPTEADATITVTVKTGDSLWSIAADHLPANASDAHIDTAWRDWYRTNSAVIGDDPNLILPGQHLQPPAQEADHR